MDHTTMKRMLELMIMLSNNRYSSIEWICDRFGISERTFFRYLNTFRDTGFVVKTIADNTYKLETTTKLNKELGDLLYFSQEEAQILKSAIDSISGENRFKQMLKKKLYAVFDYRLIANIALVPHDQEMLDILLTAQESKKKVKLVNYKSSHSNTTSDRVVEAYEIADTADQVWCYEISSHSVKMFKISRMEQVEILDEDWEYTDKHETGYVDIFRIHSTQKYPIKLQLTNRAANLLIEEYPLSVNYLKEIAENKHLLETEVCSFEGVSRFILGLYDDITILESDDLKAFLKQKIQKMTH